jgi:hypothetical protein
MWLLFRINKNEETKGIPNFWLTIFKNVQMLSEMVQEHDEPILKHLFDIKVILLESNPMVSCVLILEEVMFLKGTVSFVLSHLHDSVTESSSSKILVTTLWLHDYMGFLAACLRFSR